MYKLVFAYFQLKSIKEVNIVFPVLQDLKVPKGSGSRRGSFNPLDGDAAGGGEDEPVVSKDKSNILV